MPKRKKAPELTFQQHIADYLVREHKYGVLEQSDITDTEHFIAADLLWPFLKATQADYSFTRKTLSARARGGPLVQGLVPRAIQR
jgi:hypothetical protein